MNKIKIICISIILSGSGLFICSCSFLLSSSQVFHWCIALASSMIILGLGYLVNTMLLSKSDNFKVSPPDCSYTAIKQKAGYLVCKIMNILLCIYLLILSKIQADTFILGLGITLVLIQYLLDLFLQIYLASRKRA